MAKGRSSVCLTREQKQGPMNLLPICPKTSPNIFAAVPLYMFVRQDYPFASPLDRRENTFTLLAMLPCSIGQARIALLAAPCYSFGQARDHVHVTDRSSLIHWTGARARASVVSSHLYYMASTTPSADFPIPGASSSGNFGACLWHFLIGLFT